MGVVNQPTQTFSSKPPTLPHLLTVPPDFLQEFVGACKIHSLSRSFPSAKRSSKLGQETKVEKRKLKFSQRKHLPTG